MCNGINFKSAEEILDHLINSTHPAYFIKDNVQLRSNGKQHFIKPHQEAGYFVTRGKALELISQSMVEPGQGI